MVLNGSMHENKSKRPSACEFSKQTKIETLKRSGFCCEECGKKKYECNPPYLEIHHVVGIAIAIQYHPELSHAMISSVANAESLCVSCHKKRDVLDRRNHKELAKQLYNYFAQQTAIALLADEGESKAPARAKP